MVFVALYDCVMAARGFLAVRLRPGWMSFEDYLGNQLRNHIIVREDFVYPRVGWIFRDDRLV